MDISSSRLSAFAHATEDPKKVDLALDTVCSEEKFRPRIVKRVLKGHFGNAITRIDLNVSGRAANEFFEDFWARLSALDRDATLVEIDARLDQEGRLHLRVDKQESFRGVLQLGDQDAIKIEVSLGPRYVSADQVRHFLSSKD